jgi:hypothetical protein
MNYISLASAAFVTAAVSATTHAQSSIGFGAGGNRTSVRVSDNRIVSNSFTWSVNAGFGNSSLCAPVYRPAPVILPYYGGGCYPTVVSYSPFTQTWGNPVYVPVAVPVCTPCAPVYGGCGQFTIR